MATATVIRVDGSEEDWPHKELDLEDIRNLVGAYAVEHVRVSWEGRGGYMWTNKDGRALPVNPRATQILLDTYGRGVVVGDVVITRELPGKQPEVAVPDQGAPF